MKRVIIVGSPRSAGRSAHVAEMLFEANIDERPQDELFLVPVSEIDVGPCIGCGGCRELSEVIVVGEDGGEHVEMRPRCVFDDDMQTLYDLLDDADELTVVSPVYFSGAPAPLKCLLDRMQPYFWANTRAGEKRPASLHVLGEGGDPHGYGALVSEVRSALSCAGFGLQRILDWVGKVDEEGQITAEAVEVQVEGPVPVRLSEDSPGNGEGSSAPAQREEAKERPKLSLSGEKTASRAKAGKASRNAARGEGGGANRKSGGSTGKPAPSGRGQSGGRGKGAGAKGPNAAGARRGKPVRGGKGGSRG